MFYFFKKKRKLPDTIMNIIRKDFNTVNKDDLYTPSYDQIIEDYTRANKDNVYKICYEGAYIDEFTKSKLISEGYIVFESSRFGLPNFTITRNLSK